MKTQNVTLTTLVLSLAIASPLRAANPETEIVEVPVSQAFIPKEGFDDNDTVQVVLDGALPNSCYSLGEHTVTVNEEKKTVTVKQFAVRKKDGICAQNGANLPIDAQMMIPFQGDVLVGQLNKGEYSVNFQAQGGEKARRFDVTSAPATSIDNVRYAAVNNAYVPDVVKSGENVVARLSGILNSSCTQLAPEITVLKEGDVTVVMPPVVVTFNGPCLQVIRPFVRDLPLGPAGQEGRYLLHVRSMNGRSVNRVYSVDR